MSEMQGIEAISSRSTGRARIDRFLVVWLLASLAAWSLEPAMSALARRLARTLPSYSDPVVRYEGEEPVVEVVEREGDVLRAVSLRRVDGRWQREVGLEHLRGPQHDEMTALGFGQFGTMDRGANSSTLFTLDRGSEARVVTTLPHRKYVAMSLAGGEQWYGHRDDSRYRLWVRDGDAEPGAEVPGELLPAVIWQPDDCTLVAGDGERRVVLCPDVEGLRVVERRDGAFRASTERDLGSQIVAAASLDGVVLVGVPRCGEVQLGRVEGGRFEPLHQSIPFDDSTRRCEDQDAPVAMASTGREVLLAYVSSTGKAPALRVAGIRGDGTTAWDEQLSEGAMQELGPRALAASASGRAAALVRVEAPSMVRRGIQIWERRDGRWHAEEALSSAGVSPLGTRLAEAMAWASLVGTDPLRPAPVVLAMVVGLAQALVLGGRLQLALLWLPLTALGRPAGALLGLVLRQLSWPLHASLSHVAADLPVWIGFGAGVGLMQWLLLRSLGPRARPWIVVSALACAAGGLLQNVAADGLIRLATSLPGWLAQRVIWIVASTLDQGLGLAFVSALLTGLFLRSLLATPPAAMVRQ